MLFDFEPIYAKSLKALFQHFIIFFGPIKALFGIEVDVVQTAVLVAYFRAGQGLSHEKSVLLVVNFLGAFIHLFFLINPNLLL
jgi:hypothetical protein